MCDNTRTVLLRMRPTSESEHLHLTIRFSKPVLLKYFDISRVRDPGWTDCHYKSDIDPDHMESTTTSPQLSHHAGTLFSSHLYMHKASRISNCNKDMSFHASFYGSGACGNPGIVELAAETAETNETARLQPSREKGASVEDFDTSNLEKALGAWTRMSDGQIAQALLSSKQRLATPMVQFREIKRRLNITHRVPRPPERIQEGRRNGMNKHASTFAPGNVQDEIN